MKIFLMMELTVSSVIVNYSKKEMDRPAQLSPSGCSQV